MSTMMVNPEELRLPDDDTEIPALRQINAVAISGIIGTYEAEGIWNFDPVDIDEHGLVLGGCRRTTAARRLGLTEIPATLHEGLSTQEKFLLAVANNNSHGSRWTTKESTNIAIVGEEKYGISKTQIAVAMRIKVEAAERFPVATVEIPQGRGKRGPKVTMKKYVPVPLRKSVKGREVTPAQAATMDSFVSPLSVRAHLEDLLRIGEFEDEFRSLPPLTPDLFRVVVAVQQRLTDWVQRDAHLV